MARGRRGEFGWCYPAVRAAVVALVVVDALVRAWPASETAELSAGRGQLADSP
jgi:hypothetical protein